ncbi:hypothetical protein Q3G72_028615 [Acer saccharum]|nr:hypothetical protein Q3G72_028615 [Acer saccharum]
MISEPEGEISLMKWNEHDLEAILSDMVDGFAARRSNVIEIAFKESVNDLGLDSRGDGDGDAEADGGDEGSSSSDEVDLNFNVR